MSENTQLSPLQNDFVFQGICQIDSYPYGKVSIFIESEDKSIVNFSATMDIPLRAVHKQSVQDIRDYCLEIARQAFNAQAIIPLLRIPI
jgi:hypothetical protein